MLLFARLALVLDHSRGVSFAPKPRLPRWIASGTPRVPPLRVFLLGQGLDSESDNDEGLPVHDDEIFGFGL